MIIMTQENGFTRIEAAGLVILVPTCQTAMGDGRAEIRCGGSRLWVEYHDDGPLASSVERYFGPIS